MLIARAWLLATCPEEKVWDGHKAVASATRACELTGWKDAGALAVLAAAYAETGDFDRAVKWQEKANTLSLDDEDKTGGKERLELYKQKEPYRDEGRTDTTVTDRLGCRNPLNEESCMTSPGRVPDDHPGSRPLLL